jgi:hypothetical protein
MKRPREAVFGGDLWRAEVPKGVDRLRRAVPQRREGRDGGGTALDAARGAHAEARAHQQAEIAGARLHQHAFQDVGMAAQMHAPHASRPIEMRKRSLEPFASLPQQPSTACAANPSAVAIDGIARFRMALPVPTAAITSTLGALAVCVCPLPYGECRTRDRSCRSRFTYLRHTLLVGGLDIQGGSAMQANQLER